MACKLMLDMLELPSVECARFPSFLLFRKSEPFRILCVTPFEDRAVSSVLPFPAGTLSIGSSIRFGRNASYLT